ncbi:hypothetical protein [Parerythrobacter lacustris]|uniref:Uncharacterized protein n=1 Tax=Parerythrobacter lacustris TaxID=2969984 RepID=A0ABT1XNA1_9SPHN|nr:hypothetical protein [Parerythrobacter lacustris]MCR2833133.1 hypothetical protein [Parerythrobacter lacustris]
MSALIPGSGLAETRPEIFVYGSDKHLAWWHKQAVVRPMGTSAEGVTADLIGKFENDPNSDQICFLSQMNRNTYVGVFRADQLEIEETFASLKFDPFKLDFDFGDGTSGVARIVLIERCDGTQSFGLIITDSSSSIRFFDEWILTGELERGRSIVQYIYPSGDGGIGTAQCFECGDASLLHYDIARKKFYWEYLGD